MTLVRNAPDGTRGHRGPGRRNQGDCTRIDGVVSRHPLVPQRAPCPIAQGVAALVFQVRVYSYYKRACSSRRSGRGGGRERADDRSWVNHVNEAEPEIDIDQLMARIRVEVARRRGTSAPMPAQAATEPPSLWASMSARPTALGAGATHRADRHDGSAVPGAAPDLAPVGAAVTRLLFSVLRPITVDQRVFNGLMHSALSILTRDLQRSTSALLARRRVRRRFGRRRSAGRRPRGEGRRRGGPAAPAR
jgi:hypothetical protein